MDTIALDADVNDLNKIETTLKSIFLHNQHVEIHIINFNSTKCICQDKVLIFH